MARYTTDYLIIGNSAAGIAAAEAIRANEASSSVLMVGREPYAAYGRPLISYLLEGKTTEESMALKAPTFYADNNIDTLLGEEYEAVALDAQAHCVTLANGQDVAYGKCLLATGADALIPDEGGYTGKSNVYPFITLDDAKALGAAAIEASETAHAQGRQSRAVVVGAGLIGMKAAEALSSHVDEVIVLGRSPRALPRVLDAESARILEEHLADHGIVCKVGSAVEGLISEGDTAVGAMLANGETVLCDLVVIALGVRPNADLAANAGARVERGIVCDSSMMTSLPDVYAAGNVVCATNALNGAKQPLALWPSASYQGRLAGAHMSDALGAEPFGSEFAVNAVSFFGMSILTAGLTLPVPEDGFEERVICEGDSYAKFVVRDNKLAGYILLNRPDNAGIYTALIRDEVSLDEVDPAMFSQAPLNMGFSTEARWNRLHKAYPADLDRFGWKERA